MISGRDTLQEIDIHVLEAQSRVAATDREMDDLNSRLNRSRIEMADQHRELARFRLDEIKAGRVTARLTKAHLAAPGFMDQHKQALASLEKDVLQGQQRQQMLHQQRETCRDALDQAEDALHTQLQASKLALAKTETYRRQQEKADAADLVARRADEKASQAEADLSIKGKPYQDDELFMYLWNRQHLTSAYRHGGIFRVLDEWVARLINFKKTRANYHLLNELPQRLREHAAKAAEEADRQRQSLFEMEKRAAEKDGVVTLQAALDAAEKHLQQINDEIEIEEKRFRELLRQKNGFAAGEDEYTRKAVSMMAAELEREDIIALFQQAKSTPRPEDDAIVMRLDQLQQTQAALTDRLSELKINLQRQQKALEELVKVRESFRRSNYDAQHSSFPPNLELGVLLGEILRGRMSSGNAWGRIERAHRWDFPDVGRAGRSFGGFGGGGFRTRGRFGGGGFRTGGGF